MVGEGDAQRFELETEVGQRHGQPEANRLDIGLLQSPECEEAVSPVRLGGQGELAAFIDGEEALGDIQKIAVARHPFDIDADIDVLRHRHRREPAGV